MFTVSIVGQESNYRFWPIWLVTLVGIMLVLIQGLNLFALSVIPQDEIWFYISFNIFNLHLNTKTPL